MHLGLVCSEYPPAAPGGIGVYSKNLAEALTGFGHKVSVICKTNDSESIEMVNGVSVHNYRGRYLPWMESQLPGLAWSWFVAKALNRLVASTEIDIVEFPNWEGVGYCYLSRGRRIPAVVRLHTPYFESLAMRKMHKRTFGDGFVCWLEKQAVLKSDGWLSSTRAHASTIAQNYGLSIGDIHILPLGISLPELKSVSTVGASKPSILYVSRLEHRKGTLTLLNAIPLVLEKQPDWLFIIVGRDRPHAPDNSTFKEYFAQNYAKYAGRVQFLDCVSDQELSHHYRNCEMLAVPSNYESFGLVYIEAMSYSKPVIGCQTGGIPEVVEDGVTGYLVPPGNHQALADKILRLCQDPKLRQAMGNAARRQVEERFSRVRMAEGTLGFYQEVIRRKSSK